MRKILLIEQVPREGWIVPDYFRKQGYDVSVFNLTAYYSSLQWRSIRKLSESLWVSSITSRINEVVRSTKPAFIIFWNSDYISTAGLQAIKDTIGSGKLVCWHGDDLLNPRFNVNEQIKKIPKFDIHVTARTHLAAEYYGYGANSVLQVTWYRKSLRNNLVASDIPLSFFGSIDDKRLFLLKNLNNQVSCIGGNGWKKSGLGGSAVIYDHLSLNSMNDLIARSKISLNIFTEKNRDTTNFRNFEIPSQYSLQISERSEELNQIFTENVGIVCFSSADELNDKVQFYLHQESARLKIVEHSFQLVSQYQYSFQFQLDLLNRSLLLD